MLNSDESSEPIALWKIDAPPSPPRRYGALPQLPTVELNILRGQARQKVRKVQFPVFLIGAALDCDLVLRDPRLPEVHTYLYVTRDAISVRYLGVGPHLFVRNVRVESAQLRDGDRVQIGDAFEFEMKIRTQYPSLAQDTPMIIRWDAAQSMVRRSGVSNRQVLLSPS